MKEPSKARLLVVEDDAKLRSVLERTLTFEGYQVTSCSDGVDGLAALTDGAFDAVIMDVSMPYLDGIGLCRRMRERGHLEPVLFLTARTTIEDRVTGLDAGGDDYLTKPFSIEELLARLRALLRRPPQATDAETARIQIVHIGCLIPIGWPDRKFGPVKRVSYEHVVHHHGWKGDLRTYPPT